MFLCKTEKGIGKKWTPDVLQPQLDKSEKKLSNAKLIYI